MVILVNDVILLMMTEIVVSLISRKNLRTEVECPVTQCTFLCDVIC